MTINNIAEYLDNCKCFNNMIIPIFPKEQAAFINLWFLDNLHGSQNCFNKTTTFFKDDLIKDKEISAYFEYVLQSGNPDEALYQKGFQKILNKFCEELEIF